MKLSTLRYLTTIVDCGSYSKAAEVLTISQGICWGVPVEENKVWDYLHAADELLYQVKKVSRNSIRLGHLGDVERFANHD